MKVTEVQYCPCQTLSVVMPAKQSIGFSTVYSSFKGHTQLLHDNALLCISTVPVQG